MAVSPSAATDGESKDVHNQYENMSYDEVSQKMAESYQQLSAMLGTNLTLGTPSDEPASVSPASSAHTTPALEADEFINETMILNKQDLSEEEKHTKITKIFSRAASNGDVEKIKEMLATKELKPYIDIDATDEDGTTPLIYSACFGKVDVALALLDAGAKVDTQDKCKR
jgi:ankyrin repeat protein